MNLLFAAANIQKLFQITKILPKKLNTLSVLCDF